MDLFRAMPGSVAQGLIWGIMAIGVYITFRILDFADLTVDGSLGLGGAVAVMLILAGFLCFLSEDFVQKYPKRIINVHPSLIPSFCGAGCYGLHVHEKALEYGVKVSGATVHFVTEECDAGPIILQKAVDVLPGDTPELLQRRIMEQCEWKLLPRAVSLFCQGRLKLEGRTVRILD